MHSTVGGLGCAAVPPAPSGWAGQRFAKAFVLSLGYLSLVDLGLAAGSAWAFADGQPGPGVLFGIGAVYVAHLLGFCWCVARGLSRRTGSPPTLTATPDGDGVRFGYGFWPYYWFTAFLILTELIALAIVVVAAASVTVLGLLLAVALAAGALATGWFLVTMLRLAPGEITASPAGVSHRGLTFTYFAPWDGVFRVDAEWMNTPVLVVRAVPTAGTRLHRYTGRFGTAELRFLPTMMVRAYWLATDPAVVYHALAFYHTHRESRPELGTRAAIDRITSGRAV